MLEPKPTSHRPRVMRRSGSLALSLALAITASPAVASARHAQSMPAATGPSASPSAASGPLRIEVDQTIDDATLLRGWILERELGVAKDIPRVEGHEQWVAVQIGGATYQYRVSVTPMRDGAPLDTQKAPEACECNSEALLALLDERIAEAAAELRARPPEVPSEPEPSHDPFEYDSTSDDHPRRVGTMGSVGIGVAVFGAGLLGAGVPLALRAEDARGEPGSIETRSMTGTVIATAVGGGVALVTGASLLAADLVRHRRRTVAVVPALGPRHMGFMVTWRFRGRVIR